MGNGAAFSVGRFDEYRTVKYVAGIRVIARQDSNGHDNTPLHSHSADTMYAKRGKKGKINQVAVYKNHIKVKDIDWGHKHPGIDSEIHVHLYDENGKKFLSRLPNVDEKKIAYTVMESENG